jgi:hypothetical protein
MNPARIIGIGLLIVAPAVLRALQLDWNVQLIGALALFCGAHFRNKTLSFVVPLSSMFLGDVLLAVVTGKPSLYLFHPLFPLVYGCYAVSVAMGLGLRKYWDRIEAAQNPGDAAVTAPRHASWGSILGNWLAPIAGTTLAGSVLFFIVTNFGEWAFFDTYEKSWRGLADCYFVAIPFFRGTLVSDVVGSIVLFGGDFLLSRSPAAATES